MPDSPSRITQEWHPEDAPHIVVTLTERPGINLYTGIQRIRPDSIREHVRGSGRGHGDDRASAEARVDRLLAGEWKEFETARDILKRPYCRTFIYDHEADKYSAFILEFPGCVAEGFSIENANDLLVDAATSWILCMAANKNPIPDPFCKDDTRYGVTDLYKLWTVVEKWRADWPASSGDELARSVMEALGKISRPPTSATDPAP